MPLVLGVEYDGGAFSGFQQQKHAVSVQQTLQDALTRIADQPITIAAAGRTDAGVHATSQVVSFESTAARPLRAWMHGANALLPDAVKVRWVRQVSDVFHPRFDATARRYMYVLYESEHTSPQLDRFAVRTRGLDHCAMHEAARALIGEHDFTSFRAAGCQSSSPYRCVHRLEIHRLQFFVVVDISANAFLLHMVRNVAGSLLEVGLNRQEPCWLADLLVSGDRNLAAPTAPPHGLYLVDVSYPKMRFPPGKPPGLLAALGGLERF